jgi:NTP pyrophosphatase (non-canonical NTP hydrolase)
MANPKTNLRKRNSGLRTWKAMLDEVRRFRDERDWSQFHTPKHLAAAISIEAAELQECFLWKTDKDIAREMRGGVKREQATEELADVILYALLLADRLQVDVGKILSKKLAANALKYPVALARGNSKKYTELRPQ